MSFDLQERKHGYAQDLLVVTSCNRMTEKQREASEVWYSLFSEGSQVPEPAGRGGGHAVQ